MEELIFGKPHRSTKSPTSATATGSSRQLTSSMATSSAKHSTSIAAMNSTMVAPSVATPPPPIMTVMPPIVRPPPILSSILSTSPRLTTILASPSLMTGVVSDSSIPQAAETSPAGPIKGSTNPLPSTLTSPNKLVTIIGLAAGSAFFIAILILTLIYRKRRRKRLYTGDSLDLKDKNGSEDTFSSTTHISKKTAAAIITDAYGNTRYEANQGNLDALIEKRKDAILAEKARPIPVRSKQPQHYKPTPKLISKKHEKATEARVIPAANDETPSIEIPDVGRYFSMDSFLGSLEMVNSRWKEDNHHIGPEIPPRNPARLTRSTSLRVPRVHPSLRSEGAHHNSF